MELGGNNGIIVMPDADPELVLRAVLFGAVVLLDKDTSTRRLFLHKDVSNEITKRLVTSYSQISIGNPDSDTVMGPLVDAGAVQEFENALEIIKDQGGEILYGGNRIDSPGFFVEPTIVRATLEMEITREETLLRYYIFSSLKH